MPNSNPACGEDPQNCSSLDIQKLGEMYPKIRLSGVSLPLEFDDFKNGWETQTAPLWYLFCSSETDKWKLFGDIDPYVNEDSTGGEFPNVFFPGYTTSAD